MIKKIILGTLPILMLMMSSVLTNSLSAQTLLVEDFTYAPGAMLTDNGWTAHSAGGTNPIVTSSPGLTLTGYPSSGVGNAVALALSGEDDNRTFAAQSSGSVYAAFMVNTSEATTDPLGGYFFHLGPDPVGTTFRGRVFIAKDASNNIAFGISKALATAGNISFTPFNYALNTTYLIIVKYTIVDGATNDTVSMFVSTTVPATEPAPTATATDTTQTDVSPGTVSLRQGAIATSPTVKVDGIRVGTTWASVTQEVVPTDAPVDFNGDSKTDFVVVRNAGGASGQLTWFWNLNGSAAPTASAAWGLNSDVLVPADYDGDGKDDIAVWRPAPATQATFYILNSQGFTLRAEAFGQTGDDPTVVADYNNDGKDDLAVYRPGAQGVWYYRTTPNGPTTFLPWGTTGDKVAPGDFNGDGFADVGIARNEGGVLRHWRRLSTGVADQSTVFGASTDTIITGDFDGDGRTDAATVRAAGSLTWYWRPSGGGADRAVLFGSAGDIFVPGDYDGDGKADPAVFRSGVFYTLNSSNSAVGFYSLGSTGDRVPASFNSH